MKNLNRSNVQSQRKVNIKQLYFLVQLIICDNRNAATCATVERIFIKQNSR
jgi:hypothetical protein